MKIRIKDENKDLYRKSTITIENLNEKRFLLWIRYKSMFDIQIVSDIEIGRS